MHVQCESDGGPSRQPLMCARTESARPYPLGVGHPPSTHKKGPQNFPAPKFHPPAAHNAAPKQDPCHFSAPGGRQSAPPRPVRAVVRGAQNASAKKPHHRPKAPRSPPVRGYPRLPPPKPHHGPLMPFKRLVPSGAPPLWGVSGARWGLRVCQPPL